MKGLNNDSHLKLIFFSCLNHNSCSDQRQHSDSHIDDNDNDNNFIEAYLKYTVALHLQREKEKDDIKWI